MTEADSLSHQIPQPLPHESTGKEVWKGHDTAPIPYYQNPPSASTYTESHANQQYPPASEVVEHKDSTTLEKRVCGIRVNILLIVVSGLLLAVIVALALIAALLGNKIASIEQAIPSFASGDDVVTAAPEPPDNSHSTTPSATSTAHQAITTHVTVTDYRYIGCYINDVDRIIIPSTRRTEGKAMTNQACAHFCGPETTVFGTSDGNKCFCGTEIAERAIKGNEWNCNMQCAGKVGVMQEICGGRWFLGIWERVAK
ncbi:hypothetical protein QBC40DRAFT_212751 [Triangularia verruculosa]|uniref:WSC domain-containing protein n=1 Tax=Triangularia verruculosa TaxID=2587418 RepID=A0AAN6XBM6_9PEZI|nr:hypothetical protein QBC40DRAFT_212751 [Triangularia verruculosa]